MSNKPNPTQDPNNDFYNEQLLEDDPFDIRLSIGKSTSCPPQNLEGPLLSSSPDPTQKGSGSHSIASQEYYYYYHSLKPRDPRLPQPKWRPAFQEGLQSFGINQSIPEEGHNGQISRMSSNSNMYDNSTDISNEFNQAMNLGDNDENGSDERSYKERGHQGYNRNYQNNRGNGNQGQYQNRNQNYQQRNQNGGGSYGDRRGGHQGHSNGHDNQGHHSHNQHGHGGQNRPHNKYNQNAGGQGGYNNNAQQQQQGGQQMPGMFMPQQYGNPQIQQQQQMGMYQMNPYQQQMGMYQMDPNMAYGMGGYGGGFNNQDPRMNPMNNYNQYYMQQNAGYMMQYPNQMGMQPNMQGMQGNMQQQGYMGQQQQQQHHQQQSQHQKQGQKPFNKNFTPGQKGNYQGNNMNQKLDINSIMNNLLENCRDQNGSRLIQQHFEKADYEEQEKIFEQIYPQAYSLMTDVFGNYVIQKIFEFGNEQQKTALYQEMQGKIFELCQNAYGCRVVQKALESDSAIQDEILNEISHHVLELVEDANGNHVIQKCFEDIPIQKLQFIINEVSKHVENLAFNAFGCRVIQKILQNSTPDISKPILKILLKNAAKACRCQYANYIMQYLLEKGPQQEKEELCEYLKNNFVVLSMNKFASNVTEKSAIYGSEDFRRDVTNVLISTRQENKLGLVVLMGDRFGNYVIQRLFEGGQEEVRHKIYEAIVQPENLEEIKKTNFGKHVLDFIEKLMEGKRQ